MTAEVNQSSTLQLFCNIGERIAIKVVLGFSSFFTCPVSDFVRFNHSAMLSAPRETDVADSAKELLQLPQEPH